MLRTLSLASAVLFTAPALASTCSSPDPLDRRGPPVWIVGNVTKVVTREETLGTYMGAASVTVMPGRRRGGSNTATIEVTRVLKGNVGKQVEISSDLQDGVNLGFSFREGPIVIAAYRTKNGVLAANGCSLISSGDRVNAIKWDGPETVEGFGGETRRNPLLVLSNLSNRISALGDPSNGGALDPQRASEIDGLLGSAGDTERRVVLWEAVVKASPSAVSRARLASVYLEAGRLAEAKGEGEKAVAAGAPEAAATVATAMLHLGEKGDPSLASLKGERFRELDVSNADLRGKDLSRLHAYKFNGSGTKFGGADLTGTYLGGGLLDGADFTDANLTGASIGSSLNGVTFKGATVDKVSISSKGEGADFTNVKGKGGGFSGELTKAKFDGATLSDTRFSYVNLDRTSFDGAKLENVTFERASLKGVDLSKANITKATWKEITYDCSTKFPSDVDPVASGFRNNEACAGQPEPDLSNVLFKACDDDCLRWLVAKPGRTIQLTDTRKGFATMSASFPGKGECPDDAAYAVQSVVPSKNGYLGQLLEQGFCPSFRLHRANPPEKLFSFEGPKDVGNQSQLPRVPSMPAFPPPIGQRPSMSDRPTSLSDAIRVDMNQVSVLDYATVRNVIHPQLTAFFERGGPSSLSALSSAMNAYGKQTYLLSDMVVAALSIPSPSTADVQGAGAGSSESVAVKGIGIESVKYAELSKRVMDALEAKPSLASAPGFQAYLEEFLGTKPYQLRRPGTCENLDRAMKHFPKWGRNDKTDADLVLVASQCQNSDFGIVTKGLKDSRPEVRERSMQAWALAAANRTPAGPAGADAVRAMLADGSVPATWMRPIRGGDPKATLEEGLQALERGKDGPAPRMIQIPTPPGGGAPAQILAPSPAVAPVPLPAAPKEEKAPADVKPRARF